MTGRPDSVNNLGVIPCAISWLFRGIAEQRHKCGTKFSVRVSAVELCTNTNQIRDLLSTYHGDSELAPGVYLKDDPLFGTSLQNHSELRVHSPEKAAYYLDAAIATRTTLREEGKDSHLLFTLHVYQYSVGTKGPVAGGRSRLHLIDLGNCERGKSGSGISLSGLGNILLAIFNGQRHLPFRDHSLTHVLRECLGSLTCHTAIIVHVSPKDTNYSDTLTTLQLASRIHRLRRRKIKFPSTNNQGSGGSSGEDAKPSSSEPDPSSSDLSCDTVIYVGPLDEATDGEHPPVYIPSINSGDNRCVMSKALRGTAAEHRHKSSLARVVEEKCEKSPVHKLNSSPKMISLRSINTISPAYSQKSSPIHNASSKSTPVRKKPQGDEPITKTPVHQNLIYPSTSDEQWIDGPRFPKYKLVEARQIIKETQQVTKKETWIDGPLKETKVPVPLSAIPAQSGNIPPQINMLVSQNNESLGYGYMDNHKKNMIRKWVENQTSQIIHKSRHNSPSHKGHQAQNKESSPYKTSEAQESCGVIFEVSSRNSKNLHVEESRIRTGLKAGSKSSSIIEENLDKDNIESCRTSKKSIVKVTAKNDEDDDDSEELAEIPPALPLIQTLSSREVSMESLDSRIKERMRMNDDLSSNQSREINSIANSTGHFIDDDDEILEIIEMEEPLELVPMQDSCLQVTEEDIAFCMGLSENPLPEVDQSDEEHPLRILSQENLTVASTFTDTMSLYSDVERQIRKESYLRQAYDIYYGDLHFPDLVEQVNLHDNYSSPRHRTETQYGINYLYNSPSQNELSEEVLSPKATPLQFQSLSMSNVRDVEDYHGDGSVYSEPAYRPSDTICNSCKRTLSRPGSAIDHQDLLSTAEHEDNFGPYERYRNTEGTDARIASLRHPDGASDPNLREEKRSPAIGSSAPPPYREALKASFHLEVTTAVTSQPQPEKTEKLERSCVAKVIAGSKPDGYDSGHESTPRTGKHSPAATSRRAESGYDSVPRDSDASSLDSYPTRRAAAARAHAKKQTTAKYKQNNDRSFCAWLRNPFACKYVDTDPEISDF